MEKINYQINHLADGDDGSSITLSSKLPISRGEVIRPDDGFYYCVIGVLHEAPVAQGMDSNPTLLVSKSAMSHEEAMVAAIDYKHLPESFWPYLASPGE